MKKAILFSVAMGIIVFFSKSCKKDSNKTYEEYTIVANRGGESISFINSKTNVVDKKLVISGSEPMYVVYVASKDKLYVGDRKQNKVHIINPNTKEVESSINVGSGVFHMWADGNGNQLWVNNDIDNTISVINLNTNSVVKTISLGIKPHDVFLNADGTKAYVSVFTSLATDPDSVYMFSTATYTKTKAMAVGKDPHLYLLSNSNKLFVPCQSGEVYALNSEDLTLLNKSMYEGAHGIFPSTDQKTVYVTNISMKKLYAINAATYSQNGATTDALEATPHNLVVNNDNTKLFVTHSGASANKVSIHTLSNSAIGAGTTIETGTNPFGLTYMRRASN